MSKHPIKTSTQSITPARQTSPVSVHDAREIVKTESARGFLSFEYSYTEMSSRDGRAHVRASKTRFADGKVTREAFEAELPGDAYAHIVHETQRQMMRTLSWFMPWIPGLRSDRE